MFYSFFSILSFLLYRYEQLLYASLGIDDASDESDGEAKKQPKKVRFAEAIKAATKAVEIDERKHPLLTDLDDDDTTQKRKKKADKWFMKVRNTTGEGSDINV